MSLISDLLSYQLSFFRITISVQLVSACGKDPLIECNAIN